MLNRFLPAAQCILRCKRSPVARFEFARFPGRFPPSKGVYAALILLFFSKFSYIFISSSIRISRVATLFVCHAHIFVSSLYFPFVLCVSGETYVVGYEISHCSILLSLTYLTVSLLSLFLFNLEYYNMLQVGNEVSRRGHFWNIR